MGIDPRTVAKMMRFSKNPSFSAPFPLELVRN
jgi:hypothetical protein